MKEKRERKQSLAERAISPRCRSANTVEQRVSIKEILRWAVMARPCSPGLAQFLEGAVQEECGWAGELQQIQRHDSQRLSKLIVFLEAESLASPFWKGDQNVTFLDLPHRHECLHSGWCGLGHQSGKQSRPPVELAFLVEGNTIKSHKSMYIYAYYEN